MPAAPRSTRAHAKEVWRQRAMLTPKQGRDATYATDAYDADRKGQAWRDEPVVTSGVAA